jgi:hypothetical protein
MLSSPVCDLAPELQTSEIPEGFMKHPVYALNNIYFKNAIANEHKARSDL